MLYVEHKGQMYPVRKAADSQAFVSEEGKLVRANGKRFVLQHAEEYYPALIAIADVRLKSVTHESIEDGNSLNNRLELRANFITAYDLRDVFLALELHLENGTSKIFIREIGHMKPNKSRWLEVRIPLGSPFGQGSYDLHLFAGGEEVLTSAQSLAERTAITDALVAKRISGVQDAPPQPFTGPPPVYPAKLLEAKTAGHAIVRLHILANGSVVEPVLLEATHPAFGEAAVATMRQWRFLPKVKAGQAVETDAEIPVDFAPPGKAEKD